MRNESDLFSFLRRDGSEIPFQHFKPAGIEDINRRIGIVIKKDAYIFVLAMMIGIALIDTEAFRQRLSRHGNVGIKDMSSSCGRDTVSGCDGRESLIEVLEIFKNRDDCF